jgi:carbonic anhydrase/acetyltransferase-like protein (isoleucine patch superfamily)
VIVTFNGKTPKISSTAFVHPLAYVSGDVTLDEHVTILPFASVRGEFESIYIGPFSNVQDNCSVHADQGQPMRIGAHVNMGHNTTFHGLSVGEHTLIGMGSTIVQRCVIGSWCLIGAGSVLPEGLLVPDESIVLGVPAKIIGPIAEKHRERLRDTGSGYIDLGRRYLVGEGGLVEQ